MSELKPCPFDNDMCMCQFCEDKCNGGLHCSDCEHNDRIEHTVYLCTGFVGDTVAYLNNMKNRRVGEGEKDG